ncbi:11649_t:CDS:1, partial [Racocetra persica]
QLRKPVLRQRLLLELIDSHKQWCLILEIQDVVFVTNIKD